jgi:hypothetical protein
MAAPGERGQGKSHLMAVLYHALTDPSAMQSWLNAWAGRLQYPKMTSLPLRQGMHVITENLVHQNYKFLWDLLLERHSSRRLHSRQVGGSRHWKD